MFVRPHGSIVPTVTANAPPSMRPTTPKPERIGGQRRYQAGTLNHLAVIDTAKRAGFRVEEIKQLLHGFGRGIPAFHRWQLLARRKITELDELIARAKKMKRLLANANRC